jgi:hypothetical protein
MVLRAGFKKKTWLYFELMTCDRYRGKNTGPQCVNVSTRLSQVIFHSRFQTFAMFWMLCALIWLIRRRLNFMCRRVGTLSVPSSRLLTYKDGTDRLFQNIGMIFRCFPYLLQGNACWCLVTCHSYLFIILGARGGAVVESLHYKLEGHGIDSRGGHWIFS